MRKILNFLYDGEPLELDLRKQIVSKNYSFFYIIKIFLIKLLRILYKQYQRTFLKPSTREYLKNLEKIFYLNKKKLNSENYKKESEILKKEGFLEIGKIFNDEELKVTINELSKNLYLEPIYTDHKGFYLNSPPHNVVTGYIDTETLLKSSYIFKAANNEKILNILDAYFGCKFKLDWIWGWWSFPNGKKIGPQMFHRDYESMNFIKVFTYLTDVDEGNGPHEIICGSHKINKLYKRERFSDEKVDKYFSNNCKKTILGKKGKTFMADTFALHRGLQPQKSRRLVLVFLYSVVPSNRSPKIPFFESEKIGNDFKKRYVSSLFVE